MRHASKSVVLLPVARVATFACVAALMAGCSSTNQRVGQAGPWSSAPQQHARAFGQPAPETTGAIAPRGPAVRSQALPPLGAPPQHAYAPQPAPNWSPPPAAQPAPNWTPPPSANTWTPPASPQPAANNWTPPPSRLAAPAPVAPVAAPAMARQLPSRPSGQPLNRPAMAAVPVPPSPVARPPQERAAPAAWTAGAAIPASHTVQQGESVVSVASRYNISPQALAAANDLGPSDRLRIGQALVIPQPGQQVARRPQQPRQADPASTATTTPQPARQQQVGAAQPAAERPAAARPERPARPERGQQAQPAPAAEAAPAEAEPAPAREPQRTAAATPAPQRSSTEFRWPVRGRVVTNFGRQQGGGQSDGIGIAVPVGTPVKAAENGVVAYAGNELRGYGNLVLIRHEGDWVTAYAHNSQIMVRRGDTVQRGQVIARAGQTGNVSQPMLHFEIRRGSTPVNPTNHLSGG
jgi:murein DD-endopeptidase MepM/ murein hydrolase activator NlpD